MEYLEQKVAIIQSYPSFLVPTPIVSEFINEPIIFLI
jgi:hypothetical protein